MHPGSGFPQDVRAVFGGLGLWKCAKMTPFPSEDGYCLGDKRIYGGKRVNKYPRVAVCRGASEAGKKVFHRLWKSLWTIEKSFARVCGFYRSFLRLSRYSPDASSDANAFSARSPVMPILYI